MKCLIVDDEKLARSLVQEFLRTFPEFTELREARNGEEALREIGDWKPDLLLLDVQMPDRNGFQVVQEMQHQPVVIFITAYDQYALKAFEAHAVDYLLKPLDEERFQQAIKKALKQLPQQNGHSSNSNQSLPMEDLLSNVKKMLSPESYDSHFIVQKSGKMINLAVRDIMYLEASGDYTILHDVDGQEYLSSKTLSKLDVRLNPQSFLRIHRSTVINISYLKEIERHSSRGMTAVMNDGKSFSVSRTYASNIRDRLV